MSCARRPIARELCAAARRDPFVIAVVNGLADDRGRDGEREEERGQDDDRGHAPTRRPRAVLQGQVRGIVSLRPRKGGNSDNPCDSLYNDLYWAWRSSQYYRAGKTPTVYLLPKRGKQAFYCMKVE